MKCIHPECECAGYKQPARAKGTFFLKVGCHVCGHMESEHRRLTGVDGLICDMVRAASSKGCGYQIPVVDVPRSPVFQEHDPIYLPWGDTAQDCSVMCTCEGFVTSNLVSLQQSLYRRSETEVREKLGNLLCSFCSHPLSTHQGRESSVSVSQSEVAILSRLRLKAVVELPHHTSPVKLLLDHVKRQFVFICLHSSAALVALTTSWDSEEAISPQDTVKMETVDRAETEEEPVASSRTVPMETDSAVATGNKGRARKKSTSCVRRSARLEAKKLASLKLSTEEDLSKEVKPEAVVPEESTQRFMRDLGDSTKHKRLGEPPEIPTDSQRLSVLSRPDGLIVGLASQTSGWIGVISNKEEVVWSTLPIDGEHGSCTCLSMTESSADVYVAMGTDRGEVIVWRVCVNHMNVLTTWVGCLVDSSTQVTVIEWSPDGKILGVGCFHGDILLYLCEDGLSLIQDVTVCGSSVTCLSWSVDGKMLAVGGSDDCVQVLVNHSNTAHSKHHNYPTIFDYFKMRPMFKHTLTLRGHQSFVADVHFTRSGHLLTLGWDGQVLIWSPSRESHPHTEDSDPIGGFKIGPSTTVKFLPLALSTVDNGLLIVVGNKQSQLSVIYCS